MIWVILSLCSMTSYVASMMCLEYMKHQHRARADEASRQQPGLEINVILGGVYLLAASVALFLSTSLRESTMNLFADPHERRSLLPWILLFAVLFIIGDVFLIKGVQAAPNPGYARAVIAFEAALVTLLSWACLNSHLSTRQFIGVVLTVLGVVFVVV